MKIVYRSPKQVVIQWISALRSGEYKQGVGRLKNRETNSFCCLGVLCDLAAKDGGDKWKFDGNYKGSNHILPYIFKKYLNLKFYETSILIAMNDSGKSFKQIANYIQKNILPKYKE